MYLKNIYISDRTYEVFVEEKEKAIAHYGIKFKIPVALIKAIIKQESNGNYFAVRYEKHLKKAGWYNRTIKGVQYVLNYQYCSFGLMQVMYGIARHNGLKGSPFRLFGPDLGIKYGCKVLKRLYKRYKGNLSDIISAYNQGSNRKKDDGKYYNQHYVDEVMRYYASYGGQ